MVIRVTSPTTIAVIVTTMMTVVATSTTAHAPTGITRTTGIIDALLMTIESAGILMRTNFCTT
jgi:hypothetical protein